ncbi:hypothetical protein JYT83_00275 [bacterium AH-315-F18]|nr:hypothetical protein [bacterium AH-315-F18]
MAKNKIGAAWSRNFKHGEGSYIAGSLDMGVLGSIPFAIFVNDKRDEERKQPTHNIVVSIPSPDSEDGNKRVYMGAAWKRVAKESGKNYLFIKLELSKLGNQVLRGTDFSGHDKPVFARLSRMEKKGETSPDFALFLAEPQAEDGDKREETLNMFSTSAAGRSDAPQVDTEDHATEAA